MNSGGTPYPMVAVGYIVADDLSMYLVNRILLGLIGAWCAVSVIDQIERRDPGA